MDRRSFFFSLLGGAIAAGAATSAFAQTSPMAPAGNTQGGSDPRATTGDMPMRGSGATAPRAMGAEPRSTAGDMPVRGRTPVRRKVNRADRRSRPNKER